MHGKRHNNRRDAENERPGDAGNDQVAQHEDGPPNLHEGDFVDHVLCYRAAVLVEGAAGAVSGQEEREPRPGGFGKTFRPRLDPL